MKYGCLLLILSLLLCSLGEEDVTVTDEDEDATKEVNSTVFVPTNQWQSISPGQAVPAGLHVRMNLQTGEKEAKLIDEEDDDEKMGDRRRLHHYGHSDRRGIINKQTKPFTAEEMKDASSNEGSSDVMLLTHVPSSNDDAPPLKDNEINPQLSAWATDDVKIMTKLVAILTDTTSSSEDLIFALTELEYHVHQIDNARDLDLIGGLQPVILLLEHTNDSVQACAAHVIGAASQSNQVVQEACLRYGSLGYLIAVIGASDKEEVTYRRALYALSSLLRLNDRAVHNFTVIHDGFNVLRKSDLIQRGSRYQIKLLTMITDLLIEEAEKYADSPQEVKWLSHYLSTSGWCEVVSGLLPREVDKLCVAVVTMMNLLDGCDFTQHHSMLDGLRRGLDEQDEELLKTVNELLYRINQQISKQ